MKNRTAWDLLHAGDASLKFTNWDQWDYLALRDYSANIARAEKRTVGRFGRSLARDAFFALQGGEPIGADPIGAVWAKAMQTEGFAALQEQARESWKMTAIATNAATETVEGMIVAGIRDAASNKQVVDNRYAQRYQAALRDGADETEARETATDGMLEDAEAGTGGFEGAEDWAEVAGEAVGSALGAAAEKAEQTGEFAESIGAGLDGTPSEQINVTMQLAKRINLGTFHKLLGWTRRIVNQVSRETRGGQEQLTGYSVGEWSPKVTPYEQFALAEGDEQALIRFADSALTVRDYKSQMPEGKGPVLVVRDESGSMSPKNPQSINANWEDSKHGKALAFELALADAFAKDNRELISLPFGNQHMTPRPYTYGTAGFEKHASTFECSGATYPAPMVARAAQIADEYVPGSDILIVTDGVFSDGLVQGYQIAKSTEQFRQDGGKLWVVLIGKLDGASMKQFAETCKIAGVAGWVNIEEIEQNPHLEAVIAQMADRGPSPKRKNVTGE